MNEIKNRISHNQQFSQQRAMNHFDILHPPSEKKKEKKETGVAILKPRFFK